MSLIDERFCRRIRGGLYTEFTSSLNDDIFKQEKSNLFNCQNQTSGYHDGRLQTLNSVIAFKFISSEYIETSRKEAAVGRINSHRGETSPNSVGRSRENVILHGHVFLRAVLRHTFTFFFEEQTRRGWRNFEYNARLVVLPGNAAPSFSGVVPKLLCITVSLRRRCRETGNERERREKRRENLPF